MYFLNLDGVIALLIYELSFKEVNEIELLTHKIVMSLGVYVLYPSWYQTACLADSFLNCSQTCDTKSGSIEHSEKSIKDIHVLQVL